jgi:membrane-bound serine protease (ClpP class)
VFSDYAVPVFYTIGRLTKAILALAFTWIAPAFAASPKVVAVDVSGVVHPITADIVAGAIQQARREGATLLVVRLNTPGGLMDAMRETIEEIAASPVPVATYVAPSGARAASAGFFILESGDIAAMAPGTATGAAHPVAMGGEMDAVMKEKVTNDAAAYLRSIVTKRGHNADIAETAVRESKSFTDQEALNDHLIDLVAPNDQGLLSEINGRTVTRLNGATTTLQTAGAEVVTYQPSLRQRIISSIADPNIALILLVLGALGIYVEFSSPGLIAPGVIGAIMVLLGLSALAVLPINWLGAALLLLALTLFVLEAKFTSHGILGIGGAIAMFLGAIMLVNGPIPEMRVHWPTALALTLPFSLITVFLASLALRAHRNKVETGLEGMVGEIGTAVTALDPSGKVFVHGEYWDAVAPQSVPAGSLVRVTGLKGLVINVEPVQNQNGG